MPFDPVADAFRRWGWLQADLDPLGRLPPAAVAELDALPEAAAAPWRRLYAGPLAAEFMHILDPDRRSWVAQRMENPARPPGGRRLLERLASAELFERFLHARYVGTKRYSLEGACALITLLDAVLESAAQSGVQVALIGMSHRGRLTVMAEVVGVAPSLLFAGFEDGDPRSVLGSGDVRYHLGATGQYLTPSGGVIHMHLVSNPSHLEAVGPVMLGRARSRQCRLGESGRRRVLPVLIHGDAALAGQGIAAEILNLSGLPGFDVGGTVHLVVNNLIGFTTPPELLHTSRFATDVAHRLPIPILHVNGQEPEAVHRAGGMAAEYRARFGTDVVVDMVAYRRHGHSEVDDPTITQPLLYRALEGKPPLWREWAGRLGVPQEEQSALREAVTARLEEELGRGRGLGRPPSLRRMPSWWAPYRGGPWDPAAELDTGVAPERLEEIARAITSVPDRFSLHPKVARGLAQRLEMGLGRRPADWGAAEALAFGSLLWEGILVRLAGQDCRRGTFNQRHAALFDQASGETCVPLARLHRHQGLFDLHDTPLSEASSLGYEFGFSRDHPDALVCWEAQFGDFVNGAQVIIDQFISASEDKWDLVSGLVMLLPHGYEGQGPEHSSARPERFLQLAAEDNIQIAQPTTAAQYFHLLRRQVLRAWRKPLVVLTPKGMLRSPAAASPRGELEQGRFRPVLGDGEAARPDRILMASGKIVHELRAERARRELERAAIVSLEQLYPFPERELHDELRRHPGAPLIVWVQEEPANMGALSYVKPLLRRVASGRQVTTVSRSASASPATGSARAHALEQEALMRLAFTRSA
ncbi:MAG TPA: 2-oxoglutarate dehydrogenase E1 component [Candidatus Polarisedimenticolia bacterium]|nr:2-oxoglutarate dehydrogenase E1 component [Candidatus Polarisedimenticolia bacterium]